MQSLPRNIILDLLPVYISGEASDETKALIETYARDDAEIAALLRSGTIPMATLDGHIAAPDDLEMKTLRRVRRSIRTQMATVAAATALILTIPFIAMQFSAEVNWSVFDFIVMGLLLSGTGMTYVLLSRLSENGAYRGAVAIAAVTGFLLVWINLAVGIIGSEDHPANVLYFGVLLVGLLGTALSGLRARGMARAMFAVSTAQLLVPVIALLAWPPVLDNPPGLVGIFLLNSFFAILFAVAGLLFRRAGRD